ncbi:hypothetical protein PMI29_05514, partial [Pseudomonas sp. GM49]
MVFSRASSLLQSGIAGVTVVADGFIHGFAQAI